MAANVAEKGFRGISLRASLVERVEKYLNTSNEGYGTVAAFVSAATERALEGKHTEWDELRALVRAEIERALEERAKPSKKKGKKEA